MPYDDRDELPDNVKNPLSEVPHAQDIYKEAYNNALKQYGNENRARRTAWAAVKKKYQKGEGGKWHPKG